MPTKLIAEFVGTFILLFVGTGAIIVHSLTGEPGHIGIAFTFGAVVAALIYTFGHISGAHFNPAVTIAFWSIGEVEQKNVLPYILAQCLGAILASTLLYGLFMGQATVDNMAHLGATLPRFGVFNAWVFELILTFILMLVICGSAIHGKAVKNFAGIAIGLTVGLEAMFAGPITGASMNPARSLSPALISGHLAHLWIYLTATVAGAVLAAQLFHRQLKCKTKEECALSD